MKDMNLDAFRFSISWSRLLPSNEKKTPLTLILGKFSHSLPLLDQQKEI